MAERVQDVGVMHADVINCYRLGLGRDPETIQVIEEKASHTGVALLADVFSSGEFQQNIRMRLAAGERFRQTIYQKPPSEDLRTWIADFVPLSADGRAAALEALGWAGLYHALFADARFAADVLTGEGRALNAAFVAALAARERNDRQSRIEAKVELVSAHEIRGWALDTLSPDRRLILELIVDGVFAGATATGLYRPEIQAQFGGAGQVGFTLSRPVMDGAGLWGPAKLCEAGSGVVVSLFDLPPGRAPPMDAAAELRREIAGLRTLLNRIESRLPDFNEAFGFSRAAYGDYFETYYAPLRDQAQEPADPAPLTVILDGSTASVADLDAAFASLALQTRPPVEIIALHPDDDRRLAFEHRLAHWRESLGDATALKTIIAHDAGPAAANLAWTAASAPQLVWLRARSRLSPDALSRISRALDAGAALVYADSDKVEIRPGGAEGRHSDPQLRSGFDADLLLQQDCFGDLLGASRDLVSSFLAQVEPLLQTSYGLALHAAASRPCDAIVHLPRVLAHRAVWSTEPEDAPAELPLAAVQTHLSRFLPGASAERLTDELHGGVEAARIRWPVAASTRAAIIIPTRDRLDLLGPCLASLAATRDKNRVQAEILVVDNRSSAPATRAFLDSVSHLAPVTVLEHDGPFNWALINNRAAEQTDAAVLIFLNNDTVVLTPDWCDELCSQALRPNVGAVGARLLYADGTIQHAGCVMGGWHAFTAHEGVGAPGRDPGYVDRHALVRQVSMVTGACLATRADLFRELGGFDAIALPVEGNDADYCLRLRARGLDVIYDPRCTLYHFESKSRGYNTDAERRRQGDRAGAILRERWGAAYAEDPFYNPHFDRLGAPFERLRPPPI